MIDLAELLDFLKNTPAMQSKKSIQMALDVNALIGSVDVTSFDDLYALAGDDTAAIFQKEQQQYLLHASEGMIPSFVESHPYFAGWSSVMANVSDITAMGGHATSIVNSFWHTDAEKARLLMQGMQDACATYAVKMVGGHTHIDADFQPALAVAIQGTAKKLLSVMHVKPGQKVLIALSMQGEFHPNTTYWKCFENVDPVVLRAQLSILPELSEQNLAYSCRDISNAGILGSLLMLLEASGCGASINLNCMPKPHNTSWDHWLQIFPSYGFLLTADAHDCDAVITRFAAQNIHCVVVGETTELGEVNVHLDDQVAQFWDFKNQLFTGLHYSEQIKRVVDQNNRQELMQCRA